MKNEALTVLTYEYKHLSSTVEQHALLPYKTFPVAITVAGALALYSVEKGALTGILILYGFLLMVCWQSYIQGIVNAVGLRLVELEILINRAVGSEPQDGLVWYSRMIGDGMRQIPGFMLTSFVVAFVGLTLAGVSLLTSWPLLCKTIGDRWLCAALTVLPFVATFSIVANMIFVDWHTRRRKRELFKRALPR